MTNVLEVSDEIHLIVKKKQLEIKEKYKENRLMTAITNAAIKRGIEFVEEELELENSNYKHCQTIPNSTNKENLTEILST